MTAHLLHSAEKQGAIDFESIVTLYRVRVFRFLMASVRDADLAENLTQDCFLRAYLAFDSFRNDCKISTWLMQIALNLLRDHVKSRRLMFWRNLARRGSQFEYKCKAPSAESQLILQEQVKTIWLAAGKLPEKQRIVFYLRFVEDMSMEEISMVLGSKPATVKTHLVRAVSSVRRRLGESL